jgi:hypothetical protein
MLFLNYKSPQQMKHILMAVLILQPLLFTSCTLYRASPKYELKMSFIP